MNHSTLEAAALPQSEAPVGPQVSVILATDSYETIRAVVERLRRQTARKEIEVVLAAPSTEAVSAALAYREEFAAMQIVECPGAGIAAARAEGIRFATAPIIFIGETHSYAHPNLVEVLKPVFADSWAAATPAIGNANPKGALSWAAFLSDYGRWSTGLPSGEIQEAPPHNAAYRRSVLLELGDRLQFALGLGDELPCWMRAHGHRIYFEPAAQIDHANVNRVSHWMRERFVAGWVIAAHRAQRWTVARRLLYIGGSVLIPPLLVWRVLPGVWQNLRRKEVPLTAVPAIMLAAIVKTVGEVCGYAGITATQAERHMHEYEMHKLAYLAHSRA